MFKKLKNTIILAVTSVVLLAPGIIPGAMSVAFANNVTSGLCSGTNAATTSSNSSSCPTGDAGTFNTNIQNIARTVVNTISIVVGIIAVIFIIYGGFKYITSGGDSGKVTEAKNALIYAIIGLLIVAVSQAIVHFVLSAGSQVNTQASQS